MDFYSFYKLVIQEQQPFCEMDNFPPCGDNETHFTSQKLYKLVHNQKISAPPPYFLNHIKKQFAKE